MPDFPRTDDWALLPQALFDGECLRRDLAIHISGDRIQALCPPQALPDHLPRLHSDLIAAPGFVDLQVNGGGGVLLNADPTAQAMRAIAAAHRQRGTTAILPTLITDAPALMDRAADAIRQAAGAEGIAGIHFEGPHIAPARRGTHAARFIRPWDQHSHDLVTGLARDGIPVLLTLAPETVPPGTIRQLVTAGVVVSIGHSAGTEATTRAAIAEGAQAATHLFNAMTPMESRAPGVVGAVIDSDIHAGLIVDGHHVSDTALRIAIRARPRPDRMFLVSDAMPTVNGPDQFTLYGQSIHLSDGKLVNAEGALAGVHIDMAGAVANTVTRLGLPLEQALAMSSVIPAGLMRLSDHGHLAPRYRADLVLLTPDGQTQAVIWGGRGQLITR